MKKIVLIEVIMTYFYINRFYEKEADNNTFIGGLYKSNKVRLDQHIYIRSLHMDKIDFKTLLITIQ